MTKGWKKIDSPSDLERCVATMLNKILVNKDPLIHAGRFASLANSWVACRRLSLDTLEIQQVKEEMAELRKLVEERKHGAILSMDERKE